MPNSFIDRDIFDIFFSVAEVYVGPTIISPSSEGNWIGKVRIIPTKKNILIESKEIYVGIRVFNNTVTEEFYNALKYLAISKSEFDRFINHYYLMEWESTVSDYKPSVGNIEQFRNRIYL